MATIIIDTRTTEAKRMLEFLRSTRYAKVIDENEPVAMIKKGLEELDLARAGKLKGKSSKEFLTEL